MIEEIRQQLKEDIGQLILSKENSKWALYLLYFLVDREPELKDNQSEPIVPEHVLTLVDEMIADSLERLERLKQSD
ncbi:hypothetical protein [Amphibacillus sediminis]|uniref:hypothetical protein n=1 Tax=Amphibacillus sediminis TaxID=360185 RepID=UPI00082E0ACA|nr:hypothetical protein [Amphibacillus sediminis]